MIWQQVLQRPWQTYEKASNTSSNMQACDLVLFCKGGFWDVNTTGNRWVNSNSIYINNSAGTAIKVNKQGDNHVIVNNAIRYNGNSEFFNCLTTNLSVSALDAHSFEFNPEFLDTVNTILSAHSENSIMIDNGNISFSNNFEILNIPEIYLLI